MTEQFKETLLQDQGLEITEPYKGTHRQDQDQAETKELFKELLHQDHQLRVQDHLLQAQDLQLLHVQTVALTEEVLEAQVASAEVVALEAEAAEVLAVVHLQEEAEVDAN